jgi:hypothetical protein
MKAKEIITEIERLNARDYTGGKGYLSNFPKGVKQWKPLPGGSGLQWGAELSGHDMTIYILDPTPNEPQEELGPFVPPSYRNFRWMGAQGFKRYVARQQAEWEANVTGANKELIGKLSLGRYNGPIKNAWEVHTITVDEDRRGIGLAKALYGLVLYTMKATLVSGDAQTPGGRRNWMSLASIPGVEVKGLMSVDDNEFGPKKALPKNADKWDTRDFKTEQNEAQKKIEMLMQLGLQYVGKTSNRWNGTVHYFAFDVTGSQFNGSGELAPAIKNRLSSIYQNYGTLLYARWAGQA